MNSFRALVVAVVLLLVGPARSDAPQSTGWADKQAHVFYRLRLGDFKITVLSDGTASRDLSKIMSKPDAVHEDFRRSHEELPTDISINCFLLDTGATKVLIDTGAGALFGESSGHLVSNMRAAGYRPEDI